LILALVTSFVRTGIVLAAVVRHASWTTRGAALSAAVACAMGTLFFTALVLIDIRIVIMVSSVAVVVKIASLKVDGRKALLESGGALAYPHFS
jgi:hypothetical protein